MDILLAIRIKDALLKSKESIDYSESHTYGSPVEEQYAVGYRHGVNHTVDTVIKALEEYVEETRGE